jgi:plasmid stabilization system protein ParE
LSRRVIAAPRAERQINAAGNWWRRNRHKAPDLFDEELSRAFALIAENPGVGKPVAGRPGKRQIEILRIRYTLYYSIIDEETIGVLALWRTSRGNKPRL